MCMYIYKLYGCIPVILTNGFTPETREQMILANQGTNPVLCKLLRKLGLPEPPPCPCAATCLFWLSTLRSSLIRNFLKAHREIQVFWLCCRRPAAWRAIRPKSYYAAVGFFACAVLPPCKPSFTTEKKPGLLRHGRIFYLCPAHTLQAIPHHRSRFLWQQAQDLATQVENELSLWEQMPPQETLDPTCGPVGFWKSHATFFPCLAILAREVMAIPASSGRFRKIVFRSQPSGDAPQTAVETLTCRGTDLWTCKHCSRDFVRPRLGPTAAAVTKKQADYTAEPGLCIEMTKWWKASFYFDTSFVFQEILNRLKLSPCERPNFRASLPRLQTVVKVVCMSKCFRASLARLWPEQSLRTVHWHLVAPWWEVKVGCCLEARTWALSSVSWRTFLADTLWHL